MPSENKPQINSKYLDQHYRDYAFPLVSTFHRAFKDDIEYGLKEKRLIDTFEAILKYVTVIMIAQYRKDGINDPRVAEQLYKLSRPSLGMFSGLLRDLSKLYRARPNNPAVIDDIISIFHVENKRSYKKLDNKTFEHLKKLADTIDYPTPSNARSYKQLVDVVVTYRNKCLGHAASASRLELSQRIPSLVHVINALMEAVAAAAQCPLVQPLFDQNAGSTSNDLKLAGLLEWNGTYAPNQEPAAAFKGMRQDQLYVIFDREDPAGFIQISPLCLVCEPEIGKKDVFFLNEVKKSKFEYISYGSGVKQHIAKTSQAFPALKDAFEGMIIPAGDEDILGYNPELLEVTEESISLFNNALLSCDDGDFDIAVYFLEQSVEKSPNYHEAVRKLAELQMTEALFNDAHRTLENYLVFNPRDMASLIFDGQVLLELGHIDQAQARLNEVEQIDANYEQASVLGRMIKEKQERLDQHKDQGEDRFDHSLLLPYEKICRKLPGPFRSLPLTTCALFLIILTGALFSLFFMHGDFIMAITMISMGVVFFSIISATFRIRNLLRDSRRNFCAFLRSKSRQDKPDMIYSNLAEPVFRLNRAGKIVLWAGSAGATSLFYRITNYAPVSSLVDAVYILFCFLLSLALIYLLSCVVSYHFLLRKLRDHRIHFSLVQHPKLSIRYLSFLSRKLTMPLLWIYLAAAFTLYLGPFLANLAYIFVFSFAVVCICFLYYNTIFLVRNIIVQNKWHLLSQFSIHFHEPFFEMIIRAKKEGMDRLNELTQMRDFIDQMDVWAERKRVLATTSLLFFFIIFFSTIFMSNAMTRHIMPKISRFAYSVADTASEQIVSAESGKTDAVSIRVKNVDDTVAALWADSVEDLTRIQTHALDRDADRPARLPHQTGAAGFNFCDWKNGVHGSMDIEIPFDSDEKYILLMAYNKVYHGFLGMGGGKLSYDINVAVADVDIFAQKAFVRINTRELGYCALVKLTRDRENNTIRINSFQGKELPDQEISIFLEKITGFLDREPDAKADLTE